MNPIHDRRRDDRRPFHDSLSIQLLLPCLDEVCPARVVDSETLDASATGLRIILDEAVEQDRLYDICVEVKNHPKRFLLTAETRWCRYDERHAVYEVGLELQNGEGTDFEAWVAFFRASRWCAPVV